MNESYSIGLALVDFVPNIAFLVGAYFLVRIAAMAKSIRCSRMVMAGALLIALGGILKATWKLIYASGAGDLRLMSEIQFVLVAPGFLAVLVAVILIARRRVNLSIPPMMAIAAWKIPFLFIMTLTSLGAQGILTYISIRRGAKLAAAGFAIAFMGLLAMGGMASAEQTIEMQWVEEGINSAGQIGFMVGSILLHKNFLALGCEFPTRG
jgi:hypothetical protein